MQTGWCWCVDGKTGVHLKGTSVQGPRKPNCDVSINRRVSEFPISREWKKCSSAQKEHFKSQLLDYLRFVMKRETNANRQIQTRTLNSFEDEKVANWHFEKLDQNHNGVC